MNPKPVLKIFRNSIHPSDGNKNTRTTEYRSVSLSVSSRDVRDFYDSGIRWARTSVRRRKGSRFSSFVSFAWIQNGNYSVSGNWICRLPFGGLDGKKTVVGWSFVRWMELNVKNDGTERCTRNWKWDLVSIQLAAVWIFLCVNGLLKEVDPSWNVSWKLRNRWANV